MNIISKKKDIIELLKKGTDVEEICTDLGVSTSYVYRIKREMDELEGDKEDSDDTEENTPNGLVIPPTSGNSNDVEGDNENLEEKEDESKTNKTNGLGGVKKKKRAKKVKKEDIETDERTGGLIKWVKKQWKKILLILTLSILLVMMMLSSFLTKSQEPERPQVPRNTMRFPSINH